MSGGVSKSSRMHRDTFCPFCEGGEEKNEKKKELAMFAEKTCS